MNLAKICKQTATHRPKTQTSDGWNDVAYGAVRTIRVRRVLKQKYSRPNRELKLVDETEYLTPGAIALGDLVDGDEVLSVEELRDKRGKLLGTRFYHTPPASLGGTG